MRKITIAEKNEYVALLTKDVTKAFFVVTERCEVTYKIDTTGKQKSVEIYPDGMKYSYPTLEYAMKKAVLYLLNYASIYTQF